MPNRYYRKTIVNVPKYMKKLDMDTVEFVEKMTGKLILMVESIDKRIDDALKQGAVPEKDVVGFGYVEIPNIMVQIKKEFMIYLSKYGPPADGMFNMDLLNDIRRELGVAC